ncbi:hypothetical protein ABKP09_24855 [Peribacillus frigoritolerans]|uniref:hypothetical protein n=1 Tax=Peribacillus frigoritolerans TaxID=450367 RepID=UPI0032B4176C
MDTWKIMSTMISGKNMNQFTSEDKDIFRIQIAYTMGTAWVGNDYIRFDAAFQELFLMSGERMKKTKHRLNKPGILEEHQYRCKVLYAMGFKFITKQTSGYKIERENLLEYIDFIREFLHKYTENSQRLFLYGDFNEFWDLGKLYSKTGMLKDLQLLKAHWIDLSLLTYEIPIYIYPDFSAYQDMINLWNNSVEKYLQLDKENNQSNGNSLASNLKYTLIAGTHFVETYLSYYFYLCQAQGIFTDNPIFKTNLRKLSDEMIIENLIYKEFPDKIHEIEDLFEAFKDINKVRNALVHYTAFLEDESTNTRLQVVTDLGFIDEIADYLNTCYKLVLKVEEVTDSNILFWRFRMEDPDFKAKKIISNVQIK